MPAFLTLLLLATVPPEPPAVADFELRDPAGATHRLADWHSSRFVVVTFLSADCPLARLYAPRLNELAREYGPRGVAFTAVFPNEHDSATAVARFGKQHGVSFPLLLDPGTRVGDLLGAKRTPEVFVLDAKRLVRYRGRIDDQYDTATHRARPARRDLALALDELLDGRPVSIPATVPTGCLITRSARGTESREVTYCRDIAPILNQRCVVCHRAGAVGPFALTTFRSAAGHADTIREVLEQGRMPPWHADPRYGKFSNDCRVPDGEKQRIYDWIDAGCPEGDRADLPPAPTFPEDSGIASPDLVVSMPQPFTVPAQGIIDYQYFEIDPGFREDRWVRAVEVRPSNRRVVHHCTVFLKPPGCDHLAVPGTLGSFCLCGYAPGTPPTVLPEGMAKLVPAGWRFFFVVHYTAIGSEQTDQTSLRLVFADPKTVKKEVATQIMLDEEMTIPPRVAEHRVEQSWRVNRPVLLLSMFPHMHLRGRSFRYDVTYPDGSNEVLLDVPHYDFAWQNRYELTEPKTLPAGSVLRCTAVYDNSANNPANPDPDATVHIGPQNSDEMFNGYFDVALVDEDRTAVGPKVSAAVGRIFRPGPSAAVVLILGGWLAWRRRVRRTVSRPHSEGSISSS